MEMGILQTLTPPLLFGEPVFNILSQSLKRIILSAVFFSSMNMHMTWQLLMNGVLMALKGWMSIKLISHHSWLYLTFIFDILDLILVTDFDVPTVFVDLIYFLTFLVVNSSWFAMSCELCRKSST